MIEQLVEKIVKANIAYRLGNPIMSDSEWDILIEELKEMDSHHPILSKVGFLPSDGRKAKLPIEMASMNKIKSMEDIDDWCRLKGISKSEFVIITPKFDGLSLCVNEKTGEAFTRGDGEFGQKSDEHYSLIGNHLSSNTHRDILRSFDFTYGEVMMPKNVFVEKYSNDFANPRNLVAGLLNSKEANEPLKDCNYIKYGAIVNNDYYTKQDLIEGLNACQEVKVQYHICKISDLTEELLISLFKKYSIEYEIDGLIIELNNIQLQEQLGRETSSNNPCYARAFKHPSFEQSAETEIIGIEWNISKNSLLKPVAIVNPINLDGVIVSRCTLNNARFVKDMGIGIGSKVVIRRSGLVIPKIIEVTKKVEFTEPIIEGLEIDWSESGIELIILNISDEKVIKENISFFNIIGTDNIGDGVIRNLYNAGYKTIRDILNLTTEDLEKLDGFGKKKAKIIYDSIKKSIKNVELSKLQHATNIFAGLGSRKLKLVEHFKSKPTIEEVIKIDGFAETTARSYIDGYDKFYDFIKDLPITIKENVEVTKYSNDLEGINIVFTGIRLKEEQAIAESKGAKFSNSINKNTTYLVCKDPNSGSSKLEKARSLGINIIGVDYFLEMIK